MMKIGFDAKRAFNNRTGLGNYSRFVLNSLIQYLPHYEYIAYTPKINKELYAEFREGAARLPSINNKLYSAWWRSYGIIKDVLKDDIAIFHGLSNELPQGIEKTTIKSVVTIHDLIFLRYPALYPAVDRFFYKRKFKSACQRAAIIVAISEQTKRDIIDFYKIAPQKIQVVYQDCHEAFHQKITEMDRQTVLKKYDITQPFVLSVGTIEVRKNQLRLVEAFQEANLPNATLILVGGKTSYQDEIENFIAKNNLKNKIKILNKVPFADLPALYQSAKIFAYISVFEGFGIPIVEALHSQIPVLAATGSCLEEAGGNAAIYTNPVDKTAIATDLKNLWHDENLQQQLIENAPSHLQKFAAPQIAHELGKIYESL